jgi:aspartate/methionine/tyrosine aminotransferase
VESPLVQIATVAERMANSLKLCYGEPDLPTPAFICDAAQEAMQAGHTFYTHTAGYPELREAIAEKVHELHGVNCTPAEIMSTVGASMAIYATIRACIGPGDNAIVISPAYAIFSNGVLLNGGEPRAVPLAGDGRKYCLDLERVRAAIDGSTRLIVVNSPSNPTGWVISAAEQRALCELADAHDLMILSDEVYERIVFDRPVAPSIARVAENKERLIVVNSFSKTYNMTGWRLGWAQSSEPVIRQLYKAVEFMTSNAAAMVQQAGIVALRAGESHVTDLQRQYAARREQVIAGLTGIPGLSLPDIAGAFYAFPSIEGLTDSSDFAVRLLRETGVALAPGSAFGDSGEGSLRFCFAVSEDTLDQALSRFRNFMAAR